MLIRISKLILVTLITLSGMGFFAISSVEAGVANLMVQFETNPLFSEANFLPADSVTRWIKVTNNSGVSQKIATEAINVSNPDSLASAFNLKIKEGTNVIFDSTLAAFFTNGETFLSNLATGSQTQYNFIISFANSSNNDFQNKGLGFDILIGFQGEGGSLNPGETFSTSGGGGGGTLPPGLTIFNEANLDVQDVTMIATWQTNYFSTSRVIYSAASEPHNFNYSNPPNYGYAHSTIEDPTKVTAHQVELTGLTPGTLYYYRVISHASPDTISRSITFKTTGEAPAELPVQTPPPETPLAQTPPSANPGQPGGVVAGVNLEGEEEGTVAGVEYNEATPTEPTITPPIVLPSAEEEQNQTQPGNCLSYIWLLLILNLALDVLASYRYKNSPIGWQKFLWLIGIIAALIPFIWYPACWLIVWLLVTLVLMIILVFPKNSDSQ